MEHRLEKKLRMYPEDYYDQLEGEGPFVEAVNKKLRDYWVSTGSEMPAVTAALSVLAEFYDKHNPIV